MRTKPLISIAMATYNGEKYLKEQLDSIYAQTYKDIEVIVSDDCSTDGTLGILKQYAKSKGLKYYVNDSNLGLVKNFEKAITLCKGDYIALADQDDVWENTKLEVLARTIGENLLIHSDCSLIDAEGKTIKPYWKGHIGFDMKIENLLFGNVVTGCTVLFRKELLNTSLPFPEGLAYHDWWLAICAAKENKIHYITTCLTKYRQHTGQVSGMKTDKKHFILYRVFLDAKKRWNHIDCHRVIVFRKHLQNLLAIKNTPCLEKYTPVLNDAIAYFEDYLANQLHLKMFYIGLKRHKTVHPHKNYLFLKNFLLDIIG